MPPVRAIRVTSVAAPWAAAVLASIACVRQQVVPAVAPERVDAVAPPVGRRALLLLTPSFEQMQAANTDTEGPGDTRVDYAVGPAASRLLGTFVAGSFAAAEVRRASEAAALRTLVTGDGTAGAEVILLPRFEFQGEPYTAPTGFRRRQRFQARLRVDARSLATGAVHSWLVEGRSGGEGFFAGVGAESGRALERAVGALRDSIAANRGSL